MELQLHRLDGGRLGEYNLMVHQQEMKGPVCGQDAARLALQLRLLRREIRGDYVRGCKSTGSAIGSTLPSLAERDFWLSTYDPSGVGVELHFKYYTAPAPTQQPSCIHGALPNGTCAGQGGGPVHVALWAKRGGFAPQCAYRELLQG